MPGPFGPALRPCMAPRFRFQKPIPMNTAKRLSVLVLFGVSFLLLGGCAPEVGSERWCANLKNKPKGDWSMNEASDFAKHCIFK